MNANDVLIDLLRDNQRRLHRVLGDMPGACLHWQPDPGGNSIAVTAWHMGRLFDVFLTRHVKGDAADRERWTACGWGERTGYDPRGIGHEGWGSVNGYTRDEVAAIPRLDREQLLGHFDQVMETAAAYLGATPIDALLETAPGLGARFSKYQCIQMALLDNARHLGEIFALKAMWERASARPTATPFVHSPAPMKEYLRLIDTNTPGPRCDVTPLFADPGAFAQLVADLAEPFSAAAIDYVAGIDALGFVLGAALALRLNRGFVPIRKGGKLPVAVATAEFVDYTGQVKSLELRAGILKPGDRVLVVDEWIETGAQVQAAVDLLERAGCRIAGIAAINIDDSPIAARLCRQYACHAVWFDMQRPPAG